MVSGMPFAKGVVNYGQMKKVAARCGMCAYFFSPLGCEKVSGEVMADGVCDLFEADNTSSTEESLSVATPILFFDGYDIAKSKTELRYTLAPLYVPNTKDAHGEFVTPEDLQKASWDYVRQAIASGDNKIYKQHTGEPIGEWVEIAARQEEHTVTLQVPQEDGSVEQVSRTFPAGTIYTGVVWSEAAWPDVKKGKIRGLSLGGRAKRVEADLPD